MSDASVPRKAGKSSIARHTAPDWSFTVAVTALGLLLRLFVAIAWTREPVWDGHYYHFGATRIAAGLGYSEDVVVHGVSVWKPWSHYPVGYSAFLAALYKIFGSGLLVAPVANAIVGAGLVAAVHRLARYHLSINRARVAAAIAALHPGLIIYTAVLMTEQLAGALVTTAALACVSFRLKWRGVVVAAILLGLATLVRPSCIIAAPLISLLYPRPIWDAVKRGAVATLVAFVITMPWTLRICRVMDGCAFVSTNGGWNLAIGALTEDGRFRTLRARDGCPVVTGQVQQDRCWGRIGKEIIAKDPLHWISLVPKKLSQTYDHESFAVEYLHEADPDGWPEERRVAGRELLTAMHQLLIVAAALGVVAWPWEERRRGPRFWVQASLGAMIVLYGLFAAFSVAHPFFVLATLFPIIGLMNLPGAPAVGPVCRYLLGVIIVTSITHAVFFGDDRYHVVVTPALCILAAGALRRPRAQRTPSMAA